VQLKLESRSSPPLVFRSAVNSFISIEKFKAEAFKIMGVSIDPSKFRVIPIHRAPELMNETIQLINQEWPRSIGARMWSLESSKDSLPTCLVLTNSVPSILSDNKSSSDATPTVLAHLKLTPIPSIPSACFIESVVVWKALRGQGIGKYFMSEAEKYCKIILKLDEIYLSTTDKEEFYKKVGYEPCPPVSIFGGPCKGAFNPITKKKYMKKVLVESSDDEQY